MMLTPRGWISETASVTGSVYRSSDYQWLGMVTEVDGKFRAINRNGLDKDVPHIMRGVEWLQKWGRGRAI